MKRKGVYFRVFDYERAFRSLNQEPVMLNDFDISLESERQRLDALIFTSYDGDTLSNIPRCECTGPEAITGEDNIGIRCPICRSLCLPVTEKPLESLLWVRVPEGIPAFMNLTVWRILNKNLTYSGFSLLEYLTNVFYRSPNKEPADKMRKLERLGIPRGYTNFVNNYDDIIVALFNANLFPGNARRRKKLLQFLHQSRDVTFTTVLPFPSKLGFVTEKINGKVSADPKMAPAIEAIRTIATVFQKTPDMVNSTNMGDERAEPTRLLKESRVVRSMCKQVQFYRDFESDTAFKKPGIARKLVFGTRPDWTYRGVITSRQKPHSHGGIALPWSLSTLLFASHLSSKLLRERFTPNELKALLLENALRYHPHMERLFTELVEESPGGRIPTDFGRNPTLKRGSISFSGIDQIKSDPSDNTIGVGQLDLRDKNADFDGDALWGRLALDKKNAARMERLAPHTTVMDLNTPFKVGGGLAQPATLTSTLVEWLLEGDEISQ